MVVEDGIVMRSGEGGAMEIRFVYHGMCLDNAKGQNWNRANC